MSPDNTLRIGFVIFAVLLIAAFYRWTHPSTTFAADGTDPDWDAAVQHSRSAHEPSVLLFTANWCPYCRDLESQVLPRDDVQEELQDHYTFYTVDLSNPSQQAQAHARKCGVSGIPLMIRYDANGNETARANYLDPQQMIAWLRAGE